VIARTRRKTVPTVTVGEGSERRTVLSGSDTPPPFPQRVFRDVGGGVPGDPLRVLIGLLGGD
jgi:hypothetical protein